MFVLFGPQQRERILTQMCPKTIGVLIATTSEMIYIKNQRDATWHYVH
jgi:hypothetical protein